MKNRVNYGVTGASVAISSSSISRAVSTIDYYTNKRAGTWPTWTAPVTSGAKAIVADAAYNAQGWVSGSTDYVGTTQAFSFTRNGIQDTTGGARTVTLPYNGAKYYLEIAMTSSSLALIGLAGDANAGGWQNFPCVYMNNGAGYGGYTANLGAGLVNGDVLRIAYDSNSNVVFFGRNASWSIDPVSGTGVAIPSASTNGSVRILITSGSSLGTSLTGTFRKASQVTYTIPTGYFYASL